MFCASIRAQKIVADRVYYSIHTLYTQTGKQQKIIHTETSFLLTRKQFQGLGFGRHSELGSPQRQRRRHPSAPQQPQPREHRRRHVRTATDLQRKGLLRRLHTRSQLPPVDRSQDWQVPVRNPQMCLVQGDGGVWIGSVSGSTFPELIFIRYPSRRRCVTCCCVSSSSTLIYSDPLSQSGLVLFKLLAQFGLVLLKRFARFGHFMLFISNVKYKAI